jgi:hypothetical protein
MWCAKHSQIYAFFVVPYVVHHNVVGNTQSTGMENLYGNNKLRLKYAKYSAMIHRAINVDKLCFRGKLWFLTCYTNTVG